MSHDEREKEKKTVTLCQTCCHAKLRSLSHFIWLLIIYVYEWFAFYELCVCSILVNAWKPQNIMKQSEKRNVSQTVRRTTRKREKNESSAIFKHCNYHTLYDDAHFSDLVLSEIITIMSLSITLKSHPKAIFSFMVTQQYYIKRAKKRKRLITSIDTVSPFSFSFSLSLSS